MNEFIKLNKKSVEWGGEEGANKKHSHCLEPGHEKAYT